KSPSSSRSGSLSSPPLPSQSPKEEATEKAAESPAPATPSGTAVTKTVSNASKAWKASKPTRRSSSSWRQTRPTPVLPLTRDSGRLGGAAKLTFDYEPLLDWAGLRADIAGMVGRMVQWAEDWKSEREQEKNQRRQRRRRRRCRADGCGTGGDAKGATQEAGGEGEADEEDDDEEGEEHVQQNLEDAKQFLANADDLYSKHLERAERERYAYAVKRSVDDLIRESNLAAVQGEFRTEPFPLRVYQQYLTTYRPARDLRPEDRKAIEVDLISDLPDGYVTEAHGSNDDYSISEAWMRTYMKESSASKASASSA
ncbi:unnamed protein product, partial [Ectocarpus sp. 13 AM-2016]